MVITYSAHARQRMAMRDITEEMVRRTLDSPDELGVGYRSRSLAYRRFPQGTVKVVYVMAQQTAAVITVMWEERP